MTSQHSTPILAARQQTPVVTPNSDDHYKKLVTNAPVYPKERFGLGRQIGIGGQAQVLVAVDCHFERQITLKLLLDKNKDRFDCQKFLCHEALVTAKLNHPSIAPVHLFGRYGNEKGPLFIAMRHVAGNTLKERVNQYWKSDDKDHRALLAIVKSVIQVGRALEHAHNIGIIHRDVKPENIQLGEHGETVLLDWGIAGVDKKALKKKYVSKLLGDLVPITTIDGMPIGTWGYMSPEQAGLRNEPVGIASDIYSLGATLYTAITGKVPIYDDPRGLPDEQTAAGKEIKRRIRDGDIPDARKVNKAAPQGLATICSKAMAVAPNDRYANTDDFVEDLECWLDDAPLVHASEPFTLKQRRFYANYGRTVFYGAVAAVVVSVLTLLAWRGLANVSNLEEENLTQENEKRELQHWNTRHQKLADETSNLLTTIHDFLKSSPIGVRNRYLEEIEEHFDRIREESHGVEALNGPTVPWLVLDGNHSALAGNVDRALANYQKALKQLESKVAALSLEEYLDIAKIHWHIGALHQNQGKFQNAENAFKNALKKLQEAPDKKRIQRAIATSRIKLGGIHELRGDLKDAEQHYKLAWQYRAQVSVENGESLPLTNKTGYNQWLQSISTDDVAGHSKARELANVAGRLAGLCKTKGDFDLARKYRHLDLAISQALYDKKSTFQLGYDLALALVANADLFADGPQPKGPEALCLLAKATVLLSELRQTDPRHPKLNLDASYCQRRIGDIHRKNKDVFRASKTYAEAEKILKVIPKTAPRRRFAAAEILLAKAALARDVWMSELSIRFLNEAIDTCSGIPTKQSKDRLVQAYLDKGRLEVAMGTPDRAVESFREAMRELSTGKPDEQMTERLKKATEYATRIHQPNTQPIDRELKKLYAWRAIYLGRYEKAEELADDLVQTKVPYGHLAQSHPNVFCMEAARIYGRLANHMSGTDRMRQVKKTIAAVRQARPADDLEWLNRLKYSTDFKVVRTHAPFVAIQNEIRVRYTEKRRPKVEMPVSIERRGSTNDRAPYQGWPTSSRIKSI